MTKRIHDPSPRPTPRALALRTGRAAIPALTPTATAALHRLETWAAHVLRDRQKQEASA